MQIPRIIHQTYKTVDLPERWRGTPAAWKRLHPDWEYMFWTDEKNRELIRRVDPEFLPHYDNYKYPIQRADAVRYYILKHYGGIYVDLDIICNNSFEPIFRYLERGNKETGLFRSANSFLYNYSLTNGMMISIPHSAFFDRVISTMKDRASSTSFRLYHLLPHTTIMKTTGPCLVDDTFSSLPHKHKNDQKVFEDFMQRCNACSIDKGSCVTDNKFLTIVPGNSWHRIDSTVINYVFCNLGGISVAAICIIISIYPFNMRRGFKSKVKSRSRSIK